MQECLSKSKTELENQSWSNKVLFARIDIELMEQLTFGLLCDD